MNKKKARIERVAFIGWRGIEGCEVLDLDKGPFTGLVGGSGAGKSTLLICLDHALLPDRDALNIKPISDVQDKKKEGLDDLLGRIDSRFGFAYVVLDITSRSGNRLIAGIYVGLNDGRTEFTRWLVRDPGDLPLRSILGHEENDEEVFLQFPEFRRACAERGLDVTSCRSIGEYCRALYEAGILPADMTKLQNRKLYGKLIETTFKGGVTPEVISRLKDYLLPEANQVSDIVSGLQECTDELVKTRRAIADADRELSLLQSTYGVGKNIVLHALRWMIETEHSINERLSTEERKKANLQTTLDSYAQDIPRIEKEIQQANETKETKLQTALILLSGANVKLSKLQESRSQLDRNLEDARNNRSNFNNGKKLWKKIAGINEQQSIEWVAEWLITCRREAERQVIQIDNNLKVLQKEADRLRRGKASDLSESLAEQTGGHTLENEFDEASTKEALAAELSLCGLTDGVIGMELEDLIHLPSSDSLPDTFWFGLDVPKIADPHEVGDWYVNFAVGGYVATKKNRIPVFGSKAREKRLDEISGKIAQLGQERIDVKNEADRCEGIKSDLDKNQKIICFYLELRNNEDAIEKAVSDAEAAANVRLHEISVVEKETREIGSTIQNIGKPYDEMIRNLNNDLQEKKRKKTEGDRDIKSLSEAIVKIQDEQSAIKVERNEATLILGNDSTWMFDDAKNLDAFNETKILVQQTKWIGALGIALQDDASPDHLALLQAAEADKRLSTLKLWPMLMEIVRERVSIDRAEIDGEDLIQEMKNHRAKLDGRLILHENEVKIHARNIFQTISSSVLSHQRKINKLSRSGESIRFGNVIGIRIVLKQRWDMLAILEGFAEQLFSNRKPVDIALKEWFDAASSREDGIHLNGQQLLDYRNYVDLSIEACRKGQSWDAASSLSGGEAIGSGLAVALMLTRAIASRGEIDSGEISPLFCVDEVQRLDGVGHKMIVDFAERENFQVIVTAISLAPSYNCILYTLNRVFDPIERLVIRGLRINGNQKIA